MKPLAWLVYLASVATLFATNVGDTFEQVMAERGEPASQVSGGSVQILNYDDVTIKLRDNVVVEIKSKNENQVTVSGQQPQPAKRVEGWTTDYRAALASAASERRNVFLFFTGSDWCGWCKRLNREILSTDEFKAYADKKLVLVELDFPRSIKQSPSLRAQNQQLQKQYSISGYPTVIVLNSRGSVVGELGYQEGGPRPFIAKLKSLER